jgi:hypothetical protein
MRHTNRITEQLISYATGIDARLCLLAGAIQYAAHFVLGRWNSKELRFEIVPGCEYGQFIFAAALVGALGLAAILID